MLSHARILLFLDQEVITNHYLSHSSGSSSFWWTLFKKAYGSIVSNQIWMTFGINVLKVNVGLTEPDF